MKDIAMNLDIQRDRKKWRRINKGQKEIQVDIRRMDRDKENTIERDRREFGLTKRQR